MTLENTLKKLLENSDRSVELLERIANSVESLAGMPVVEHRSMSAAVPEILPSVLTPQAPGPIPDTPIIPQAAPQADSVQPGPPPPPDVLPFTDSDSLAQYVINKWKALGPERGSKIQGIMQNFACGNIKDLKPENYSAFHQAIEEL